MDMDMENTDNSLIMDYSQTVEPSLIDVIDLTKDSPSESVRQSRSVRHSRLHQTHLSDMFFIHHNITNGSNPRRSLSPIILGNISLRNPSDIRDTYTQTRNPRQERETSRFTRLNETLTLDDTIKENGEACYTIEPDNKKEPIPLKCPICLELLTSNLKPITTRCGHLFCTKCLESFISISKKCATCKSNITLSSCTRIYL